MLETQVRIKRRSNGLELSDAEDRLIRRDYGQEQFLTAVSLTAGTKTEIRAQLDSIQYIYIKVTGAAATIQLFKENSPESWSFTDMALFVGTSITAFSLQASVDTTVYIYVAGT